MICLARSEEQQQQQWQEVILEAKRRKNTHTRTIGIRTQTLTDPKRVLNRRELSKRSNSLTSAARLTLMPQLICCCGLLYHKVLFIFATKHARQLGVSKNDNHFGWWVPPANHQLDRRCHTGPLTCRQRIKMTQLFQTQFFHGGSFRILAVLLRQVATRRARGGNDHTHES